MREIKKAFFEIVDTKNERIPWLIKEFVVPLCPFMSDIATELAKLHTLTGADYSRQVERIAQMGVFHPLEGEIDILIAGGEQHADFGNLLNAARKAVTHGYKVYILPNPKGIRTADFIFEYKRIYVVYDLKTVQGKGSAGTRLLESIGQSNRILLHMATNYNARLLASDIRMYFEANDKALEVLIFKGKKKLSVTRRFTMNPMFNRLFRKVYEK